MRLKTKARISRKAIETPFLIWSRSNIMQIDKQRNLVRTHWHPLSAMRQTLHRGVWVWLLAKQVQTLDRDVPHAGGIRSCCEGKLRRASVSPTPIHGHPDCTSDLHPLRLKDQEAAIRPAGQEVARCEAP